MHLVHIVNTHARNNKRLNTKAFSALQITLGYHGPPAMEARLFYFTKSEHFKIVMCVKKQVLTSIRQGRYT